MQKTTTRCQHCFVQISYRSPGILRKSYPSSVNSHDTSGAWPRKALRCFQLSFLVSWSQKRTLNVYSPAAYIMRGTKSEFQFRGDRMSRLWARTSRYIDLGSSHGAGNWSTSILDYQTPVWQWAQLTGKQQQLLVSKSPRTWVKKVSCSVVSDILWPHGLLCP